MSGFKSSALVISEKATPVAPSNPGEVTVVARNGSLYKYDGVTETEIGGGVSVAGNAGEVVSLVGDGDIQSSGATIAPLPTYTSVEIDGTYSTSELGNQMITFTTDEDNIFNLTNTSFLPGTVYVYLAVFNTAGYLNVKLHIDGSFFADMADGKYYKLTIVAGVAVSLTEVLSFPITNANSTQLVRGIDTRLNHYRYVPASATALGRAGDYAADSSWLYICTAENTWKRVGLSSF